MKLGEKIKNIREANAMTQGDLADKLHLTQSNISQMESGKRGLNESDIINICNIFNITSDYLLGLSDESKPYTVSNIDPMLKTIIESWEVLSISNKHRLYADCLEYLENQDYNTDKGKKGGVSVAQGEK